MGESSSRASQWMVMSLCFDNLKFVGQFLCPALGDRRHHQFLQSPRNSSRYPWQSNWFIAKFVRVLRREPPRPIEGFGFTV
jgi:hypothetical protein